MSGTIDRDTRAQAELARLTASIVLDFGRLRRLDAEAAASLLRQLPALAATEEIRP